MSVLRSGARVGVGCPDDGGGFPEGSGDAGTGVARRMHVAALRIFLHMSVGCVAGGVAGGVSGFCLMSRPEVSTVILSTVVGALYGMALGFAVRALKHALREGSELRERSRRGDVSGVKRLCEGGVWVDLPDGKGRTALMWAILGKRLTTVTALIDSGADVDHVDCGGATPLTLACGGGRPEIVKLLIDSGADLDKALVSAMRAGDVGVAKALLLRGAELDRPDCDGRTPFAIAFECGCRDIVETLVGEDVTLLNGAFACCVLQRNRECAGRLIERGAKVNEVLADAVRAGRADIVKELVDRYGADVDYVRDGDDRTLLVDAIERGDVEVLETLIGSGARVDHFDLLHGTPLTYATARGCTEIVKRLLEYGATLDHVDARGRTPLAYAAEGGHPGTVKELIRRGARVDHINEKEGGGTLLMATISSDAVRGGVDEATFDLRRLAVVRELIAHNVPLNRADHKGDTALIMAVVSCRTEIVEALVAHGAPVNEAGSGGRTPLIVAVGMCDARSPGIVRVLLESGARVDDVDHEGRRPLVIAVRNGNLELVKELIRYDVRFDVGDQKNRTPLMHACMCGNVEIVKELLKYRLNADAIDCDGRTAVSLVEDERCGPDIVGALATYGVDLDRADHAKCTPLMHACAFGRMHIAEELINRGARTDLTDCEGKGVFDRSIGSVACAEMLQRVCGTDYPAPSEHGGSHIFVEVGSKVGGASRGGRL